MNEKMNATKFIEELVRRNNRFYEYLESHPSEKKLFEDWSHGRREGVFDDEIYFCERMMEVSREPSSELWEYVFEGVMVGDPMRKKCLYVETYYAYLWLLDVTGMREPMGDILDLFEYVPATELIEEETDNE